MEKEFKRAERPEHRRDHWTVWEVLHAGDGPCGKPEENEWTRPVSAQEAAEQYIKDREESIQNEYGIEGGDFYEVAVQVNDDSAAFFTVRASIQFRAEYQGT